jgi:hypothetical protein
VRSLGRRLLVSGGHIFAELDGSLSLSSSDIWGHGGVAGWRRYCGWFYSLQELHRAHKSLKKGSRKGRAQITASRHAMRCKGSAGIVDSMCGPDSELPIETYSYAGGTLVQGQKIVGGKDFIADCSL